MDSTTSGSSEITINSPVTSYTYAELTSPVTSYTYGKLTSPVTSYTYGKLTDEKEFKRNLAARIYSNSGFTSIETGKPIDANTIAKDAINKANIFWDALPSSWKKE